MIEDNIDPELRYIAQKKQWDKIELKTLKYIGNEYDKAADGVIRTELKQEAIKWINHYNQQICNKCNNKEYVEGMVFSLKHFFNINEEDLK